jgi:hypothetical protein
LPELPGFNKENLASEMLERPSLFDAVKQQFGVKLEPQKDRWSITSSNMWRSRRRIKLSKRLETPPMVCICTSPYVLSLLTRNYLLRGGGRTHAIVVPEWAISD